ncbi:MAG: hypothetical protein QE487_11885 [Fluviicola sp.]|nr:hypothetical protein [Fluviicola sp.]
MHIINFITTLSLFLVISLSSNAQKKIADIDFSKLMKDITITKAGTQQIECSIWMPTIYWEVVARDNPNMPADAVEQIISIVDNYIIICFVKASINEKTLAYEPMQESVIRKKLVLEFNGKTYKALYYNKLPDEVQNIKDILEPTFARMLGEFGNGLSVFFFEIKDDEGNNLIDPTQKGSFNLKLDDTFMTFNLPLPSLCEDKICTTDDVLFPGNYIYCPFHGTELKVVKNEEDASEELDDVPLNDAPTEK